MAVKRKNRRKSASRQAKKRAKNTPIVTKSKPKPRRVAKPPRAKLVKAKRVKRVLKPKLIKVGPASTRDPKTIQKALLELQRRGLTKSKATIKNIKKNTKRLNKLVSKYRKALEGKKYRSVAKATKKRTVKPRVGPRGGLGVLKPPVKRKIPKRLKKTGLRFEEEDVPGGKIISLFIPTDYAHLRRTLFALDKDPFIVDLLNKGWRYAFRFLGNWSLRTFDNAQAVLDYLDHYEMEDDQVEKFISMELVAVHLGFDLDIERHVGVRRKRQRRRSQRENTRRNERRETMKTRYPERYKSMKLREAARAKSYRSRKKDKTSDK